MLRISATVICVPAVLMLAGSAVAASAQEGVADATCWTDQPGVIGSVYHPTDPEAVVLRMARGGGLRPPESSFLFDGPVFTLYGSNVAIHRAPAASLRATRPLPALRCTRLAPAEVDALLTYALDERSGQLAPATVSGRLTNIVESDGIDVVDAVDVFYRDAWTETARLRMDDPRLSGLWSATVGLNRYGFVDGDAEGAAETYTGSVEVTNEDGTWVGTMLGCSGCGERDTKMVKLVGSGAYEGLSALLFSRRNPASLYGVIVVGDLETPLGVDDP